MRKGYQLGERAKKFKMFSVFTTPIVKGRDIEDRLKERDKKKRLRGRTQKKKDFRGRTQKKDLDRQRHSTKGGGQKKMRFLGNRGKDRDNRHVRRERHYGGVTRLGLRKDSVTRLSLRKFSKKVIFISFSRLSNPSRITPRPVLP